jgi:hypothetical protein
MAVFVTRRGLLCEVVVNTVPAVCWLIGRELKSSSEVAVKGRSVGR